MNIPIMNADKINAIWDLFDWNEYSEKLTDLLGTAPSRFEVTMVITRSFTKQINLVAPDATPAERAFMLGIYIGCGLASWDWLVDFARRQLAESQTLTLTE